MGHSIHQAITPNDNEAQENLSQLAIKDIIKIGQDNQELTEDKLNTNITQIVHKEWFSTKKNKVEGGIEENGSSWAW